MLELKVSQECRQRIRLLRYSWEGVPTAHNMEFMIIMAVRTIMIMIRRMIKIMRMITIMRVIKIMRMIKIMRINKIMRMIIITTMIMRTTMVRMIMRMMLSIKSAHYRKYGV